MLGIYKGYLNTPNGEIFIKLLKRQKMLVKPVVMWFNPKFVDVTNLVDVGANLQRSIQDIVLSRYACYLIAMNGDPRKEVIALAQTYFAVKTHKQEQLELQKEDSLCLQIDLHPFSWTDNKKNPHRSAGFILVDHQGFEPWTP